MAASHKENQPIRGPGKTNKIKYLPWPFRNAQYARLQGKPT
jgi:hypothetical protein